MWDARSREIFGVPESHKVTPDTFYDAIHFDDYERVMETVYHSAEQRNFYAVSYRIWRPSGELALVRSEGQWFYDAQGRPFRMMGLCYDLTTKEE